MNRRLFTALSVALSLIGAAAHADPNDPTNYTPPPAEAPVKPADGLPGERVALHVAPVLFAPIGNLADSTQAGAGALLGFDYRLAARFVFTARGGYISTFEQSQSIGGRSLKSNVDFAPFLGGIKWYLAEDNEGLFFGAEAGPVLAIASSRIVGQATPGTPVNVQASASQTNLGGAASIGYELGRWDLRAGLMSLDIGHVGNSTGLMMSAALSFAQF